MGKDEFAGISIEFNRMMTSIKAKVELLPYVPETVWRMAHRKAADEGEQAASAKKMLTVLFCDLRGFTTYSDKRQSEEVVGFLGRFFGAASDAVSKEGGVVDKFIGDACLAIFDLPESAGAAAALRAGMAIVRFVRDDAQAQEGGVGIRVGINTGDVILGSVGFGGRKDYTVIGAEVNKAQRLEAACEPGTVLVSAESYRQIREAMPDVEGEELPPFTAKGVAEKLIAYKIRV